MHVVVEIILRRKNYTELIQKMILQTRDKRLICMIGEGRFGKSGNQKAIGGFEAGRNTRKQEIMIFKIF